MKPASVCFAVKPTCYAKQLGIQSEVGRGNDDDRTQAGLTYSRSSQPPSTYTAKNDYEAKIGQKISWEEFAELFPGAFAQGGGQVTIARATVVKKE